MSHVFVLSGYLCPDTKAHLAKLIIDLGGVYLDPKVLDSNCTHVIATPLARSEKCMCACAAGLWILPEQYILDSHKAGCWLDEELYEWTGESLIAYYNPDISALVGCAVSRNRRIVKENNKRRFSEWTCFLALSDHKKEVVYERILRYGGANVYRTSSLEELTKDVLTDITHVFTEATNVDSVKHIVQHSCLYLSVDYLRNFLLRERQPEVSEFDIQTYSPSIDPLCGMQLKKCMNRNRLKCPRLVIDVENLKTPPNRDQKPASNSKMEERSLMNFESVRLETTTENENLSQVKCYVSTQCHQALIKHIFNLPEIKYLKERLWDVDIQDVTGSALVENEEAPAPFPDALASMFQNCIDEKDVNCALGVLTETLMCKWLPPPKFLTTLFSVILESKNSSSEYDTLDIFIREHPPTTRNVSEMYWKAFSTKDANSRLYSDVLRKCISSKTQESTLFYRFVDILSIDFKSFLKRVVDPSSELLESNSCPLVTFVFWPDCKVGSISKNCKELIELIPEVLKDDTHLVVLQRMLGLVLECVRLCNINRRNKREASIISSNCRKFAMEILKTCAETFQDHSLVMAFVHSVEPVWFTLLISELLIQTVPGMGYKKSDQDILSLKKIVTHYMLPNIMRAPKDVDSELNRVRQTMNQHESKESKVKKKTEQINLKNCKGETKLHIACMKNDVKLVQSLLNTPGIDVNSRDYAGWTPLHEACNRGYVECVRLLLKWKPRQEFMPKDGHERKCFVDLFAKSNEDGVTPLHDAVHCNQLETVKLLLKYGGQELMHLTDNKGRTPMDLARSSIMAEVLLSEISEISEVEDVSHEEEDDSPCPKTPSTKLQKISEDQCTIFLDYFTCLFISYLSWNCLKEINDSWRCFETFYKDLNYDLVSEIYEIVHGFFPEDKKIVDTLCEDLHVMSVLKEHFKKLESHIEKLTRKNKSCFLAELIVLRTQISN